MKFFGEVVNKANEINPVLGTSMEVAFEFIPYVGKAISSIKTHRLTKRVKEHSKQLERIAKLHSSERLSAGYINERIFPIVLESLIEEHEDAKINLILNGFENVFIEKKTNESMVINYFDTLRDLRYMDVKRLYYLADITDEFSFGTQDEEERAVTRNIDKKLQNFGFFGLESIAFGVGEQEVTKDNVRIYPYGERFLNFITVHLDESGDTE
ncbi:hypothetical protein [Oceanobacillus halophilus]|uniref:DUF4393 domain-containing protein n=1 Tax=Oceanobacillus halophilus TaxID=930130 RepID=A0A494ZT16_9BACI|nr:hypothetical protein [Oceanobacillus halophilus]RKQ28661.1 hypothetical protein D8M06_18495 [Oceanobacillus halophilus]